MVLKRTEKQVRSLDPLKRCRVSYKNDSKIYEILLKDVNWRRRVVSITILFDKPRYYFNGSDW